MAIQQKFKAYEVVTGHTEAEVSQKVTLMVSEGGWQLYGPIMITAMPDSIFFAQALMLFEFVNVSDEPVVETQQ